MTNDAKTVAILRTDLRNLVRRDLPRVVEIERQSFPDPWTEADFRAALLDSRTHGLVAQVGPVAAGHLVYRKEADTIRVLRLAVTPAYRRLSVGSQLLTKVVAEAARVGLEAACVTVRERSLGAQLWLRENGWRAVGVGRGAFGHEDAFDFEFRVERW